MNEDAPKSTPAPEPEPAPESAPAPASEPKPSPLYQLRRLHDAADLACTEWIRVKRADGSTDEDVAAAKAHYEACLEARDAAEHRAES
jgi:hypothetical protein